MSGASSAKKSEVLNDAVLQAAAPKTKTTAKVDQAQQIEITSNPFYNVLFDQSMSLEEKQAQVTTLTTSTLDRSEDRARVKAYDEFREWLSAQQTALAKNIIELSNVDSMAELQAVLKDMNTDLLNFEDKMNPIMDIIESIHYLRTNGLMGDAFKQIKEDQEADERARAEIAKLEAEAAGLGTEIQDLKEKKFGASTQRKFFGLGGLTAEAQIAIAKADDRLAEIREEGEKKKAKIAELRSGLGGKKDTGENAVHMHRLRELLDMSKDENRDRVIALRDAASGFITTAQTRTGSLRGQFDQLHGQLLNVEDSNQNMLKVYAVLNDGMADASTKNAEMRTGLADAPEGETNVQMMTREEKLRALDNHVSHLTRSQGETMAAYGDLNQQAVRVYTMRESTDQQMDTARQINTQGVAATADRLATVLTAVSGAALGEASEAAKDTLDAMRKSTNDISSREVIRVAMGTSEINDSMETVFKELAEIKEVQDAATGITRNGMAELQQNMAKLREQADTVKKSLNERVAAASMSGEDAKMTAQPAVAAAPTAFPGV